MGRRKNRFSDEKSEVRSAIYNNISDQLNYVTTTRGGIGQNGRATNCLRDSFFLLNLHSGSSPSSSSSSASPPPPPAPMIVIMSFKLPVQFRFRKHVNFRGSENIPMYEGLHNSGNIGKLLLKIRCKHLAICESVDQKVKLIEEREMRPEFLRLRTDVRQRKNDILTGRYPCRR